MGPRLSMKLKESGLPPTSQARVMVLKRSVGKTCNYTINLTLFIYKISRFSLFHQCSTELARFSNEIDSNVFKVLRASYLDQCSTELARFSNEIDSNVFKVLRA